MPDPRLDVHIRTSADTSGAKAAAAEVKKAGDAAKETAKQAQATARSVNDAGESFEKGAAAGRVLAGALQGNVFALTQLGPAIKALGTALKANIIGVLVTLGGLLASTIIPLLTGFRKKLDETKDSAEAADRALQLRKEAVESVSKAISQLAKDADAAEKKLRALQTRNDAIADAELALELAQIRDREGISDVERLRLENEARDRHAASRRQRARETNEAIIRSQEGTRARAVNQVSDAETELREAAQRNAQLAGQRRNILQRISDAEGATASNPIEAAANLRRLNEARQELREFDQAMAEAGEQSRLLAEQFAKARKTLEEVSQTTDERISEVRSQEELESRLFSISQQTQQITRATAARRAPAVDTSGLQAQRDALAAEAAQLEAESRGGDFSFGGALRRSAAAEALERNRQEIARVNTELLLADQKNHAAQMALVKRQTAQTNSNTREIEKLEVRDKNSRP